MRCLVRVRFCVLRGETCAFVFPAFFFTSCPVLRPRFRKLPSAGTRGRACTSRSAQAAILSRDARSLPLVGRWHARHRGSLAPPAPLLCPLASHAPRCALGEFGVLALTAGAIYVLYARTDSARTKPSPFPSHFA